MKIARERDLEEPFRITDHGIGQETAVREDRQRVAKGGGIIRDLPCGVGPLRNQAIEKVDGIVRIGQGRQQRGYASGRGRRKFSEIDKFRARTNGVAELDLVVETQHYHNYKGSARLPNNNVGNRRYQGGGVPGM